jgi:hypothetical protein
MINEQGLEKKIEETPEASLLKTMGVIRQTGIIGDYANKTGMLVMRLSDIKTPEELNEMIGHYKDKQNQFVKYEDYLKAKMKIYFQLEKEKISINEVVAPENEWRVKWMNEAAETFNIIFDIYNPNAPDAKQNYIDTMERLRNLSLIMGELVYGETPKEYLKALP